jgi:hypothetical protein
MALPNQSVLVSVTHTDGSVSVLTFVTFGRLIGDALGAVRAGPEGYFIRNPTVDNIQTEVNKTFSNVGRVGGQMVPVASWRLIDLSALPADRAYRNAWKDTGTTIVHDMPKAREIHRGKLRELRAPVLAALDVEWMKAVAAKKNPDADAVEAKRQVLRDLPADPRIDAAQTVEELKAIALPAS